MSEQIFHVGDRVVGNGVESGVDISGLCGVIVNVLRSGRYSVSFDEFQGRFHSCGGKAPLGHGWNCWSGVLLPEDEHDTLAGAHLPELSLLLM